MVYSITSLHKPAKPIPHTAPPYQQITYVRQSKNDLPTHNSTSSLIILANRQNAMNEKQNISKTSINTAFSVFGYKKSTRRDSNPRPSPWQGDTPPLSHSCVSGYHHDSMDLLKCQDKKSVVYCGGYEKIYWSGQHMEVKERKKHWKHQ